MAKLSIKFGKAKNLDARLRNQAGKLSPIVPGVIEDPDYMLTSPLITRGWRALILAHRARHRNDTKGSDYANIEVIDNSKGFATIPNGFNKEVGSSINQVGKKAEFRKETVKKTGLRFITKDQHPTLSKISIDANGFVSSDISKALKTSDIPKNDIIIFNMEASPYQKVIIQNKPTQVEFKGETTWASIKSVGRNTPLYHFTGSEDTIQFNISWFCNNKDNPSEVIDKCRFLESWTKSDGYKSAPPILYIQWGNSGIFDNQTFILISATYTLKGFNNGHRVVSSKSDGTRQVEVIDGKLFPSYATQELIFKRVSATNLTYEDILPVNKIPPTWRT